MPFLTQWLDLWKYRYTNGKPQRARNTCFHKPCLCGSISCNSQVHVLLSEGRCAVRNRGPTKGCTTSNADRGGTHQIKALYLCVPSLWGQLKKKWQ